MRKKGEVNDLEVGSVLREVRDVADELDEQRVVRLEHSLDHVVQPVLRL